MSLKKNMVKRVTNMEDDNFKVLLKELRRDEGDNMRGTRHYLYKDSIGVVTVGIGRNTEIGFSEDEVTLMLRNDTLAAIEDIKDLLGSEIYESLSDVRKRVLVNMRFNLGLTRLRGFKRFLKAIRANKWIEAATEMVDSKWAEQVGVRADRLVAMMITG